MKSYEEYLILLQGTKTEKEEIEFVKYFSLLPMLLVIEKLMKRKNSGKKPFSTAFEYEKRITEIDNTIDLIDTRLSTGKTDNEKVEEALKKCVETIRKAQEEIKSASLKGDFCWVEKEITSILNMDDKGGILK